MSTCSVITHHTCTSTSRRTARAMGFEADRDCSNLMLLTPTSLSIERWQKRPDSPWLMETFDQRRAGGLLLPPGERRPTT